MQGTFTPPTGERVRTDSQRRYVIWRTWTDAKPSIVRRTDNLVTARRVVQTSRYYIVDTHTGEVVR